MSPPISVIKIFLGTAFLIGSVAGCGAQSIAVPWTGYGHDAQHTGISAVPAKAMNGIRWQAPVDLAPQYSGAALLIHYGSPLITRANTIIFPVKTGATCGFRMEARNAADGTVKWTMPTDFTLPAHNWVPSCAGTLTPKNRFFFPGAGGTVYYRDTPDAATGAAGQFAFYGMENYDAAVKINTPLTSDRYGNVFFGFVVEGTVMLPGNVPLLGGIARVAEDGTGTWISATSAAVDGGITKVVHNCAPALSNDHRTIYIAVSTGTFGGGYLVSLDSRTLSPIARVRLKDAQTPTSDALLPDDGTASPTVGPDGDVYFGVFAAYGAFSYNHFRGWLLHFDSTLSQTKTPGAFGWDDTASVVPASAVSLYSGTSKYLLLTKYNNYAGFAGGDGVNKVAILDPNDTQEDSVTGATVMKEVLIKAGPTPDPEHVTPDTPNAVREWCINTAVVDAVGKCAIVNNEDGKVYRWDFTNNTLTQAVAFPSGIGQAYTPTLLGMDGTAYAISNAILFAVGE